ncbi:MAG: hypothetical protein IKV57_03105 [Clostridia bacterium]|nr:hypothetical protein [Clostridia bacterium]
MKDLTRIREIYDAAFDRIKNVHIACFKDMEDPLFLISNEYPGLWMEHTYDSVLLATIDPAYIYLAENAINLFVDRQTDEGQLPFAVMDGSKHPSGKTAVCYWQIQECVSFFTLALEVYRLNNDREFLEKIYASGQKWDSWLRKYRMTTGRGLIEMFCGYDTGHDNSGRLEGISCPGNYVKDGVTQNAGVLPPDDGITPILAVDMNCNFYGDEKALAEMARILGKPEEADAWEASAAAVKEKLFRYCWNEEDGFFYDVDRHGNQRKYKSSTIFHLFLEKVLDPCEDRNMIDRIYREHIKNPDEFWTPYPFPSMAVNDPSCSSHKNYNCWGYYTQGGIVLRCSRWMDAYGWHDDYAYVCEKWLETWTKHYDTVKLAQEIDPITGEPTQCSQWYSSCMMGYIYAAKRLGLI